MKRQQRKEDSAGYVLLFATAVCGCYLRLLFAAAICGCYLRLLFATAVRGLH